MPSSLFSRFHLTGIFLLFCAIGLSAQDAPAPQNPEALLQELDRLSKGSESRSQQRRSEAIAKIQAAAGSPNSALELYLNALQEVKYPGKSQDFFKWKQDHQDDISHPSYRNATHLQLCYLLLGLKRSDQNDAFTQVPEVISYLNNLQSLHFLEDAYVAPKPMKGSKPLPCPADKINQESANLIKSSLSSFEIVQWLQLQDLLPKEDFNDSAGDYRGILENNVKAPLRGKKDQRLPGIWDLQITTESARANSSTNSADALQFKTDRMPSLIYGKFTDMAVIGQPNRALNGIMELIRTYPDSASRSTWMETVRGLLSNPPVIPDVAPGGGASTPSSSPSPKTPVKQQ